MKNNYRFLSLLSFAFLTLSTAGALADIPQELLVAVQRNDLAEMQSLRQQGVDLDGIEPIRRRTAMHLAVMGNHVTAIQSLRTAGASLNVRDNAGWTPIMLAIDEGNTPAFETLVRLGANADVQSASRRTALHMAAANGRYDYAYTLVTNAGARTDLVDNLRNTALERALLRADYMEREGESPDAYYLTAAILLVFGRSAHPNSMPQGLMRLAGLYARDQVRAADLVDGLRREERGQGNFMGRLQQRLIVAEREEEESERELAEMRASSQASSNSNSNSNSDSVSPVTPLSFASPSLSDERGSEDNGSASPQPLVLPDFSNMAPLVAILAVMSTVTSSKTDK
jgi:ankyrin repeat protein